MKFSFVLILCILGFVAAANAGNNYQWGEIGPDDYKLALDVVKKNFFVGLVQKYKYIYQQKNAATALTITAIKVTDQKKKNGATATLISGGPGSKGATISFTSQRGYGIKDKVEIWGR